MDKKVKTTIYVDPELYQKLRIKLLLAHKTFTTWVQEQIQEELKK